MTEPTSPDPQDTAWVTIETPYDGAWLRAFLDDVERVYRINPFMEFMEFTALAANQFRVKARNLSNAKTTETLFTVQRTPTGLDVRYADGLKTATTFEIAETPGGTAKLIITDHYGGTSTQERESRLDEVDKSLEQWGHGIYRYLRLWKKWSGLPGWSWYMRRVWQSMKPMARRISFLLIMITLAEFIIFLLIFLVFWLELGKYV